MSPASSGSIEPPSAGLPPRHGAPHRTQNPIPESLHRILNDGMATLGAHDQMERLYSRNVLIWCIFLEMLEDRADGAEGVSGLVVEGGYADAGAEGRDRRDFGGWARSGSPLCCDRRGSWARCLLPPPWNSRGGGGLRGAGMGSV